MRKLVLGVAAAMVAAPAMAATTIEFKRDSGETAVVTLDDGTATMADGTTLSYTYDPETLTMCFQAEGQDDRCVTFAEGNPEPMVGDAVRYKAGDGAEGTATVTAITE